MVKVLGCSMRLNDLNEYLVSHGVVTEPETKRQCHRSKYFVVLQTPLNCVSGFRLIGFTKESFLGLK